MKPPPIAFFLFGANVAALDGVGPVLALACFLLTAPARCPLLIALAFAASDMSGSLAGSVAGGDRVAELLENALNDDLAALVVKTFAQRVQPL